MHPNMTDPGCVRQLERSAAGASCYEECISPSLEVANRTAETLTMSNTLCAYYRKAKAPLIITTVRVAVEVVARNKTSNWLTLMLVFEGARWRPTTRFTLVLGTGYCQPLPATASFGISISTSSSRSPSLADPISNTHDTPVRGESAAVRGESAGVIHAPPTTTHARAAVTR